MTIQEALCGVTKNCRKIWSFLGREPLSLMFWQCNNRNNNVGEWMVESILSHLGESVGAGVNFTQDLRVDSFCDYYS